MYSTTYHLLDHTAGKCWPQIEGFTEGYQMDSERSMRKMSAFSIPEIDPDFDGLLLDKKAEITDFISQSWLHTSGFIVSEKVVKILKSFRLPVSQFYELGLYQKKGLFQRPEKIEGYYWAQILGDLSERVDFSNSRFFSRHRRGHRLQDLSFSSIEDFHQQKQDIDPSLSISPEKISFHRTLSEIPDIFRLTFLGKHFYVSDQLKQGLEMENCTGIQLKRKINVVW